MHTTNLKLHYSTFCPQRVFMCFLWISVQIAIISLYSINWDIFWTATSTWTNFINTWNNKI